LTYLTVSIKHVGGIDKNSSGPASTLEVWL